VTTEKSRVDEILEGAKERAKKRAKLGETLDKEMTLPAAMVMPREMGEDEAMENWCNNISLKCTADSVLNKEEVSEMSKTESIRQAEELLGESPLHPPPNLPSPHPSSMGEPSHQPPKASSEEVDCRVSQGSHCYVTQGTSPPCAPAA
jgi:hypothetical protein